MWGNPKDYKAVGERLEAFRKEAGLTQIELAARLKKPQSFVSSCESGQRRVDLVELGKIAVALGFDPLRMCEDILSTALKFAPRRRR